jgi:hypothetical protein
VGNYLHLSSISLIHLANKTEVEVVTHCDELQVNKADRTEVEVVPHCDELQVDTADRNEVDVVTHHSG